MAQPSALLDQPRPAPDVYLEHAPPRLSLRSVSKTWGRHLRVLDDVDFELPPGQLTFVAGANGAGKTTLLRIVAGLVAPERGSVRLDGLDPRRNRALYHRRLGFVAAGQGGLYARVTVAQHLDLWARLTFVPRRLRRLALERSLERFALREVRGRRVDRLSMGQRQHLRLAMAFLHEPRLVLLDEPRNSLDRDGLGLLNDVVDDFVGAGGTVVWGAPTGAEAPSAGAAVYLLADGKISGG